MKGMVKGIIIGAVIAAIGVGLLLLGLSLNGWKFGKKINFQSKTFTAAEENTKVILDVDAGSVKTEFYDGDKIEVTFPTADGFKTEITEVAGTLTVNGPKRVWYKNWFRSYDVPDTVIKMPAGAKLEMKFDIDAGSAYLADGDYADVTVDIDAGSFIAGNVKCLSLLCDIDAGSVKISSAECQTFRINMDAGTAKIDKLTAQNSDIDVDAGNSTVGFAGAEEEYTVTVKVSAGSTNISNRAGNTDKVINVKVSAGKFSASFGN